MKTISLLGLFLIPFSLLAQQKQLIFYHLPDSLVEQSLREKKFAFDPYQLEEVYQTLPERYNYDEPYFRDSVPRGYYVVAVLEDHWERFRFHHHSDFRSADVRHLFEERFVYFSNDRYPQDSLQARIDGERLPFDAEVGLFRLSEGHRSGIISLSSPVETAHYRFEIEEEKGFVITEISSLSRQANRIERSAKPDEAKSLLRIGYKKWYYLDQIQGYLALSQPIYRPGDTLKLKAHLLDAEANGLTESLSLVLEQRYGGRPIPLGEVRPLRAGIYLHEFVLGDSLRIDQTYQLRLQNEDGKTLVQNEFRLEDYLLDEYKFACWQDSSYNLLADSCVLMMRARTENGMPVPEVQVFLKIKPTRVEEAPAGPTYLPISILDTVIDLPPTGFLRLSLAPGLFADFACQYRVETRFLAPNAEQENISRTYRRIAKAPTKPSYPFSSAAPRNYLQSGGAQTQNHVSLFLHNSQHEALIYRIYRDQKLIKEGFTRDSLRWESAQTQAHFWRLEWKRHERSQTENYTLTPTASFLDIEITQWDTIKPGQQVEATIKVRDHLGQPVPDTELSLWGINAQFRRNNLPELPYLGPRMLERSKTQDIDLDRAEGSPFEKNWWLKPARAEQLGLMAQDYYRLHYPDSILFHYQAIEDSSVAMYAPFVFDSLGQAKKIHFIWQDSIIRYYAEANPGHPYCLISEQEGTVALDLRLQNQLLHLPEVELRKGYKLILSLNLQALPSRVQTEYRPEQLTQAEQNIRDRHFPVIQHHPEHQQAYLWQNGDPYPLAIDYGGPYRAGPFRQDSVYLLYPGYVGRRFLWEQNLAHYPDKWELQRKPIPNHLRLLVLNEYSPETIFTAVPRTLEEIDWNKKQINISRALDYDRAYSPTLYGQLYPLEIFQKARDIYLVYFSYADSLYRYRKRYTGEHIELDLSPGYWQLQVYRADSLCLRYDSLHIKKDFSLLLALDQASADTISQSALPALSSFEYLDPWNQKPSTLYVEGDPGKTQLQVRLVDPFGEAVEGARVYLEPHSSGQKVAISDQEGIARFYAVHNEESEVHIFHPEYRYRKTRADSLIALEPMPEAKLERWQKALQRPHRTTNYYVYGKQYTRLFYLAPPDPYIPNEALFYQDTIHPQRMYLLLDSAMLPTKMPASARAEIWPNDFGFGQPEKRTHWGLSMGGGHAQMRSIFDQGLSWYADASLWVYLKPRLGLSWQNRFGQQYAQAETGPMIGRPGSLWEDWYGEDLIYPAIRRDIGSSSMIMQFDLVHRLRWQFSLGLGAGLQLGQIRLDASRNAQRYDYQEIVAQDLNATPLRNPDRIDLLAALRDEEYEQTYPLDTRIAPYALGAAQLNLRLSQRWSLQANYQLGISRNFDWEAGLDVGAPQTSLDVRHWQQQIGIGLSYRMGRRMESLWWQNPVTAYHGELTGNKRKRTGLADAIKYDRDNDGVPDLYDKEPNSPEGMYYDSKGIAVVPSGRALDSDRDDALSNRRNRKLEDLNLSVSKPAISDSSKIRYDMTILKVKDETRQDILDQLRQDFRDAAFWEADLRTDAQGAVSLTIQYPDDITAWNLYAIAMNENRQIGYTKDTVVAQAPLLARLDLPQTLRKGDQIDLVGRVQSLQSGEQAILTRFVLEDSLFEERPVTLEGFWREAQRYQPSDTGTVLLAYLLRDSSGYQEGELRELDILDNRIPESLGRYYYLEGDTSLRLDLAADFAASQNVQLIAYHQPIEFMQARARWLARYPHGCNEQLASRLIAVHLQLQWSSDSTEKSVLRRRQAQIIRKLARSQHPNGSWGWWADNEGDAWMTQYTLEALEVVIPTHKAIQRGQSWLLKAFRDPDSDREADPSPKLAYYLLKRQLIKPTEYQLPELAASETEPDVYTQLLRLAILRQLGDSISVDQVLRLSQRDALGARYWSARGWRWYGSQMECTALAYELIHQIDLTHPALGQTRQFLLMADHAWQDHTVETARMLQVLASSPMQRQQAPQLQLSMAGNARLYDEFPLRQSLRAEPVELRKAGGGPILLSLSQTQLLEEAPAVDSLFAISSSIQQEGTRLDSLQKGTQMELVVDLVVQYQSDHVMLEVPIPAGCTYASKPQPGDEAYREYRRDRTTIYLESLRPGRYQFQIPLESRFSGEYQLMPVRAELMYVPTQFGRNQKKVVRIEP